MTEPATPKRPTPGRRRVTIFLVVAGGILALVVLMLGRSHNLFSRKVTLFATFDNVSGLVTGAPVRLAGVDVGMVRKIEFFIDKDKVKRVRATLAVEQGAMDNIRKDSVAQLSSKGLLGDMLINITIGSPDADPVKDNDYLIAEPVLGIGQMIASVEQAIAKVSLLATDVDKSVKLVLTPEMARDVGRIMHSTAALMERVEHGDGLVHALIYDKGITENTEAALADVRSIAQKIDSTIGHIEKVLAEVETGDGMLHALVYDKQGAAIAKNLTKLAKELGETVEQIRTGNGMLHSLIYEKDKTNLVQDLAQAAKIVRQVAEEVNEGKGSLGGLLKDPTVYQDLKTVLGNIKRNIILKSVIRMTIEKDDLKRTGEVKE